MSKTLMRLVMSRGRIQVVTGATPNQERDCPRKNRDPLSTEMFVLKASIDPCVVCIVCESVRVCICNTTDSEPTS